MTRHHRYVGESHFPPPENEGQPCRWVSIGGKFTFGPVTPALAAKLDEREAARAARLASANEKRSETMASGERETRRKLIDPWRNRA